MNAQNALPSVGQEACSLFGEPLLRYRIGLIGFEEIVKIDEVSMVSFFWLQSDEYDPHFTRDGKIDIGCCDYLCTFIQYDMFAVTIIGIYWGHMHALPNFDIVVPLNSVRTISWAQAFKCGGF